MLKSAKRILPVEVFAWFTSTEDHQSTAFEPDVYTTQQKNRAVPPGSRRSLASEGFEVFEVFVSGEPLQDHALVALVPHYSTVVLAKST